MSPGPQSDEVPRDVHMEGVVTARGGDEERQKPADEHMRVVGESSVQREGGAVGGSTQLTRRTSGEEPSRGKQREDQLSPVEGEIQVVDVWESVGQMPRWREDSGLNGLGLEYSHMRVIPPPPPLYLQPGSKFVGTQQSERQRYDVEVEIKYVDMRESFLCGYLKIQALEMAKITDMQLPGLTDDHPTLTTYFEGEIIGNKYSFITEHEGWGANELDDINHWGKFAPFRPYLKQTRKGGGLPTVKDVEQKENIFMRWKEHFLVPDHRVKTINGASFEGFYYICFNQIQGEVNGIYFHSKSER
ncbi:hypothetical protein N0V88_002829 [Collariella sp. IMI 366227]|nr:hypothetical protein N0V88_002829 [Collariella sp. IMI 366227]